MTRTLAEVCEITMGQAPTGDSYNDQGEGLPLIAGAGDFKGQRLAPTKFTTKPGKVSKAGDIVLSIRASIGAKVWSDGEYCLGRGVAGLRPGPQLDDKYLWHWLTRYERELGSKGRGATFLQVNKTDIGEMPIQLPALGEQRRIAAILDQAATVRDKRRQALAQLDDLTQSTFHQIFGVGGLPETQLRELVDADDRINYGVVQPGDHVADGVPLIRVSDLRAGGVDRTRLKRVSREIESKYKRSRIRGNEVLVSCVGSIGVIAMTSQGDVGANVARAVTRVPISNSDLRLYVAAVLSSPRVQRYFTNELRTVSQPTLNGKQIGETVIPVPPQPALEEFAKRVRALVAAHELVRNHARELDVLSASLQARAFRGAL